MTRFCPFNWYITYLLNRPPKFMNLVSSQNACRDFMEKKSWGTSSVSKMDLILSSLEPLQANATCVQLPHKYKPITLVPILSHSYSLCHNVFFFLCKCKWRRWDLIRYICYKESKYLLGSSSNIFKIYQILYAWARNSLDQDMTSNTSFRYLLLLGLIFILESIYYFSSKKN